MAVKRKYMENELMVVNIIQTSQYLENKLASILKEYELTNVQYNILRILRGASPELLGVGEIKERISFRNSDMSRLLDRLVGKDYVKREICKENRRKMDVCISELGLEALSELDIKIEEALDLFYSNVISPKEAESLTKALKIIRNKIN